MEDLPPAPRIGYARRSYRAANQPPSQKKPTRVQDRLLVGCGWGCFSLVLLPFVAWGIALWLGPWIFDRLNPPFVPPEHAQQCGSFNAGTLQDTPAAKQCFWLAYQSCHTAVLNVGFYGDDSGVTHNFVVEKQANHCALSDYLQSPVAPRSIEDLLGLGYKVQFLGFYQCKGLEQVGKGLRFVACGSEGNIDLDTGQGMTLPAARVT